MPTDNGSASQEIGADNEQNREVVSDGESSSVRRASNKVEEIKKS